MAILFSNNATTTVAGSITAASTTVALAAGTGAKFPSPTGGDYFCATFYDQATKTVNEIVHVTARSGDTCTIVRGQEGTVAQAWSASDIFANLVTAGTLNAFMQTGSGPANTSIVYVGTDVSTTPGLVVCPTIPVPASYVTGMLFNIKVKNTNPGPVNLQFNGQPSVAAVRTDGSPMVGGNLVGSQEMTFIYNGVNFNALIPPIPQAPPQTTFYVRTDGNDNNSGFSNDAANAFASISGAMSKIKTRYISQNAITIRVADGTYIDGITDNEGYIAAWNIVGNTTNPGNVVVNATSVSAGAYPPTGTPGRGCVSYGAANIYISGITFQSYLENVAGATGNLWVTTCNFTAPTSGAVGPIAAYAGGTVALLGTCSYSGANTVPWIIGASSGGVIQLGYHDALSTSNLTFNINGTPLVTTCSVLATSNGCVVMYNAASTFAGGIPVTNQYLCVAAGGLVFDTGVTNTLPGTKPGVVTAPGWVSHG